MRQKRAEMTIGGGPQMFGGQFGNGENYSMSQMNCDNNSNDSEKNSDMVRTEMLT